MTRTKNPVSDPALVASETPGPPAGRPALLVLEDGTSAVGTTFSGSGEVLAEFVFNTAMTGYQEVLTDPSYRGQIVVMTYPEIGIYGMNDEDGESPAIQVAGFVVHRAVRRPSNRRATAALPEVLNRHGVLGIEGVDTRALAKRIRTVGAMRGAVSTEEVDPRRLLARILDSPRIEEVDLAGAALPPSSDSCSGPRIVILDAGAKRSIQTCLKDRGAAVAPLPFTTAFHDIAACAPDGVLVANGPGDPARLTATVETIRAVVRAGIPVGGICLGHQLLGLAVGGTSYKMRFGHRGINHPVLDIARGRVHVTSHNHGFAIEPASLGIAWTLGEGTSDRSRFPEVPPRGESPLGFGTVEMTHVSLNDGTLEGLRLVDRPAMSVQYHPEAAPGPHDAVGFFDDFLSLVEAHHA